MSEKRTLEGGNEHQNSAVSRPPPLKKRFTTGFGPNITPSSTSFTQEEALTVRMQDNAMNDPMAIDNLECLSKTELLERMRFTKTECLTTKNRLTTIKDDSIQTDFMTGCIRLQLDLLRDEFVSAANMFVYPTTVSGNDDVELVIQEIQSMGIMIVNEIKAWFARVGELQKANNQNIIEFIQSEIRHLSDSYTALEQYATQLRNEDDFKIQQIETISRDVRYTTKRLEKTQEMFENCVENIEAVEKKKDRVKSEIVTELLRDKKEETLAPLTPETPAKNIDHSQVQLEEYQFLSNIRIKESVDVKKETYRLQDHADRLMTQVEMISDEQILKSSFVHHLESSIDFHRGRIYYYEHRRMNLEKEYDKLKKERRHLKEQIESEKTFQGNILATEEKNLKSNLARITSQRNHLRQLCNSESEKEIQFKEKCKYITNEAEEQKQKMIQLEQEIKAKRKNDGSIAVEESHRLKDILSQIDLTHGIMHVLGQYDNGEPLPSDHFKERINRLKSDFSRLSSTHAFSLLDQLVKQRIQLTLVIDFFENTDRLLFAQMDCDGLVYEGRTARMNSIIHEKKDQILRIQAEKTKYSQTFPGLENERTKISNTINASKRIVHQQADRIKVKEEKEQELVAQVNEQEVVLKKLVDDFENYHLEVDDYSQECVELEKRLEIYETQLLELKRIAIEKTKALDEETSLQEQVESEYEKVQKKWSMITLGENPASQQLIDEVEELRAQFRCSTCKTRTRKCILLSCYHTFCNECIRIRLETRQRRCPSCALNFGASDVKELYLYNTQ